MQNLGREFANTANNVIGNIFVSQELLSTETVTSACKLFSVLSKSDALMLFIRVKQGLQSDSNSPKQTGLTRKQYYTRLRNLVDAGLIQRRGNIYTHTTLGSLIYENYLTIVLQGIKNFKQIQMIDTLKQSSVLSSDEITNLMNVVLKKKV